MTAWLVKLKLNPVMKTSFKNGQLINAEMLDGKEVNPICKDIFKAIYGVDDIQYNEGEGTFEFEWHPAKTHCKAYPKVKRNDLIKLIQDKLHYNIFCYNKNSMEEEDYVCIRSKELKKISTVEIKSRTFVIKFYYHISVESL